MLALGIGYELIVNHSCHRNCFVSSVYVDRSQTQSKSYSAEFMKH